MKKIIYYVRLFIGMLIKGIRHIIYKKRSEKYHALLKDPRWKKRRKEILQRDHYKCTECGKTDYLHVHHKYYKRGLMPWEYPDEALITLCRGCHYKTHFLRPTK